MNDQSEAGGEVLMASDTTKFVQNGSLTEKNALLLEINFTAGAIKEDTYMTRRSLPSKQLGPSIRLFSRVSKVGFGNQNCPAQYGKTKTYNSITCKLVVSGTNKI